MRIIQQLKGVKFGCKLISLLFVLALIIGRENIFVGFEMAYQANSINITYLFIIVLGLLFLIFNLVAAIGLYRLKKWGFIFAYIAITYSTIFFSTAYIPFVSRIFPIRFGWVALILINLTFLLYIVYIDVKLRHKNWLSRIGLIK